MTTHLTIYTQEHAIWSLKAELVNPQRPRRNLDEVEFAPFGY